MPRVAISWEGQWDNNYVLIDQSLPDGQAQSISTAFKDFDFHINQILFSNNSLTGDNFSAILQSLSTEQRRQLKSIVYTNKNEISYEAFEQMRDIYLQKRAPHTLHELKLVDVKCCDAEVVSQILIELLRDFRLRSFSFSKMSMDVRSLNYLVTIFEQKLPSLIEIDVSWNKIPAEKMKSICKALKTNSYIRSLNFAFNPVSRDDNMKELGYFVRNNPVLQHLDLSGVLQTPSQI